MRMSAQEARRRFITQRVARLATVNHNGEPHLVPVTFAVIGNGVAFAIDHKAKRSANLLRLRNITRNPAVCLLVDCYADDWTKLWWVRADGAATIYPSPADVPALGEALSRKYPQYQHHAPEGPLVLTAVNRWSGWAASPIA